MTVPAPDPLAGASGGGGAGGLTAESDEILLVDSGNSDTPFIRRFEKDDAGLITDFDDYELDGQTAYTFTGPAVPFTPAETVYNDGSPIITRPTNAGPQTVVTYSRLTNADTPHAVAADALSVFYVVLADGVTVEGEAVPTGVAVEHGRDGYRTDALSITLDATGEVLLIEERAA